MEKQLLDSKTSFEAMVNVDCFMEQLPRKVYEDGWPEDKWEKVYKLFKLSNFNIVKI